MQTLILAGGRAMRLSPLTDDTPMPLLYLPGGTVLDYLLHHLSLLPVTRTGIILQYRGDQVARYLGAPSTIEPIPQNPPFTLLSALASAAAWVEEPTLVIHGNYYMSHSLHYFLEEADPDCPSFLLPESGGESADWDSVGAYLLPPEVFKLAAEIVEADYPVNLYEGLRSAGMIPAAVPLMGWGRCINTPQDLLAVNRYLLTNWHDTVHPPEAGVGYDAMNYTWIAPDADVDGSVNGLFTTIGPGAYVRNSRLYNTLIYPGVQLENAREENVLLAKTGTSLFYLYNPMQATAVP